MVRACSGHRPAVLASDGTNDDKVCDQMDGGIEKKNHNFRVSSKDQNFCVDVKN